MAEPKTRPTEASVADFIAAISHQGRRTDAMAIDEVIRAASGETPVMWGPSIVGYGEHTYTTTRNQQTSWPVIAFAPRKNELVLYLNTEIEPALFEALGPHRRGVGCLYVKRLADVDADTLRALVERSIELARV